MTRMKAFYIHSLFSAVIILTFLAVIFFLWYPFPFAAVSDVQKGLKILITAYLIVGPLLTLILFKPGKAGLKFDMVLVSVLQTALILYGAYDLYVERPYYAVFVKDRFEVLNEKDIDPSRIDNQALLSKPWGQLVFVVANMPADVEEQQRIMEETLFEGKPDIDRRPEYWSPYAQDIDAVKKGARQLSDLLARRPDKAAEINQSINDTAAMGELLYVPVIGKQQVFSLVLDPLTFLPIAIIDADPWAKPVTPEV
jgi:hypothetical protein